MEGCRDMHTHGLRVKMTVADMVAMVKAAYSVQRGGSLWLQPCTLEHIPDCQLLGKVSQLVALGAHLAWKQLKLSFK